MGIHARFEMNISDRNEKISPVFEALAVVFIDDGFELGLESLRRNAILQEDITVVIQREQKEVYYRDINNLKTSFYSDLIV
jgi:hypothetical protein